MSVFDGLSWAIIGQPINLSFAFQLLQRLALHAGGPAGEGLVAPPAPATVAALEPEELRLEVLPDFGGLEATVAALEPEELRLEVLPDFGGLEATVAALEPEALRR